MNINDEVCGISEQTESFVSLNMAKNSLKNIALLQEFKAYLRKRNCEVIEEVVFTKIMPTDRRYRADYLINGNIIVEINGGSWINGRHNRASIVKGRKYTSYENDLNKLNLAQFHGFKVFQFTYAQLQRKEYESYI